MSSGSRKFWEEVGKGHMKFLKKEENANASNEKEMKLIEKGNGCGHDWANKRMSMKTCE